MDNELKKTTKCEVNPKKIKYLGINIDRGMQNLYLYNYATTWQNIQNEISRWSNMNFSWSARIALVKMSILPKLNFLFQNLPINIEDKTFNNWQSQINKFIWNYKRARISYKVI